MEDIFLALKDEFGIAKAVMILVGLAVFFISAKGVCAGVWEYVRLRMRRRLLKIDKGALLKHGLFKKYNFLITQRLKRLHCRCVLRKRIFQDLLTYRVQSFNDKIAAFINDKDLSDMTPLDFQYDVSGMLYSIYTDWEEKAEKEGIPKVVIDRFRDVLEPMRQTIDSFVNLSPSNYYSYESNYARMQALMDMLCGFEELVLMELERTLDNMNGEISHSTYRGFSCQHCRVCMSHHLQKADPPKEQQV